MDHLFKALDAQFAHQELMLMCASTTNEALKKENEALRTECKRLEGELRKEHLQNETLKGQLAAIPATLSRAELEEIREAYE